MLCCSCSKKQFLESLLFTKQIKNSKSRTLRQGGGAATKEKVRLSNDQLPHSILQAGLSYDMFFSTSGSTR